jgi:hypothetical protein
MFKTIQIWRQPLAVILITLLAMLFSMFAVPAMVRAQNIWMIFNPNGHLPEVITQYWEVDSFMFHYNDHTTAASVTIKFRVYGSDYKAMEALYPEGVYLDPVKIQIAQHTFTTGVLECSLRPKFTEAKCEISAGGSKAEATYQIGATGPLCIEPATY